MGATECVVTKRAILISAQFNTSSFVHGLKSNHRVPMSYHCYLAVMFCALYSTVRQYGWLS